ncbi:MAG: ABC transporter ATP-binding protein [Archaeoglobus sp.]|nr:ABC transporter ATP-binding protein [Archaeoglobus sp.]
MQAVHALKVSGIKKSYGDFPALKGMDMELKRGEIVGLIGENGAGKSTFLKILAGLLDPDSGSVEYFGMDFFKNKDQIKKRIGYLPETDSLYGNMNAMDYLRFFASLYSVNEWENKASSLLEMLNLPKDRLIEGFSKGMKRKLSIARSLIHDPDVLIYDEPTGGLDPSTSLFISNFLKQLKEKGKSILFSAHNMYYVESTCDRIIILKKGEVLYSGEIEDLMKISTKYLINYMENGVRKSIRIEGEELNPFIQELAEKNAKVLDIIKEVPRLEEVYFKIIG